MAKLNIPVKCSTCKYYAVGYADGENSLDRITVKTSLCTKHKSYDAECSKACKKNGCKDYHLNWNIYDKIMKEQK